MKFSLVLSMVRQQKSRRSTDRLCLLGLIAWGLVAFSLAGCGGQPKFASDRVFVARLSSEIGEPVSEEGLTRIEELLTSAFGTPDAPLLPSSVPKHLVSIDKIRRAAGPVFSDEEDVHFGLYRKHCVRCHGLTGDGKGPAARLLDPYPRDFRLGKFKFKSTPIGTKPTRQDLARILHNGIPGTSMPSFRLLKDEEIDALIDYVFYLTARGETERSLLNQLTLVDGNDPASLTIYQSKLSQATEAAREETQPWSATSVGHTEELEELVIEHYQKWDVPPSIEPKMPAEFPILRSDHSLKQLFPPSLGAQDAPKTAQEESILRGEVVFHSQAASCSGCHGKSGIGGTQVIDYDDWTKAWISTAGVKPEDKATFAIFKKAGALKPIPISARDLRHGVFRGGDRPEDIYFRIVLGIEGTTMPAAALQPEVPGGLSERQVWDLVNYCLSLKDQKASDQAAQSGDSKR